MQTPHRLAVMIEQTQARFLLIRDKVASALLLPQTQGASHGFWEQRCLAGTPPPTQPQESAGSVGTASSSGSANGHPPDVPLPAPARASSGGGGTIWPLGEGKSLSTPNPSPPFPAPPWRSTGLQKVTSLCTPPPSGNQAWAVCRGEGRRGLEPGRGQESPLISLKSRF